LTNQGRTRAIAYGAVALFALGAVVLTKPLPRAAKLPALAMRAQVPAPSTWRERFDTLGSRETLVAVLGRAGIPAREAREALSTKLLEPGRIRIGMPVHTRSDVRDSMPTEIMLGLKIDQILHLKRNVDGWKGEIENLPWTTDTITVAGTIYSNLYAAMSKATNGTLAAAQSDQLTVALADLYEFRIDMSRELRVGDAFKVVAERQHGPGGAVRIGKVLAASMTLSTKQVEAISFRSESATSEWFDQEGRPLRCCFLRAPVEFRRISSRFGNRRHPVLGTMRRHEGTDYAADAGTPVRAIGDGVVIKAGWGNGYGNVVEIRHPNGFVTRYGHLRGFAKGIQRGTRVEASRTIAYVGSTGLSTGPHLHFEVMVNGVQRNPSTALGAQTIRPIPESERPAFVIARDEARELMRSAPRFASAEPSSTKNGSQ
jgi:murein DD-endopeptidase MepM/ murein hydrolase activator NlpD